MTVVTRQFSFTITVLTRTTVREDLEDLLLFSLVISTIKELVTEIEVSMDKKKTLFNKRIFYKIDWNEGRLQREQHDA